MKNTVFTVFPLEYIKPIADYAYDLATEKVRGCRNQREAVPGIIRTILFGGDMFGVHQNAVLEDIPNKSERVKKGDIIYRVNGVKFSGKSFYCEYRQFLDVVTVDHVTKSMIIGTYGERVRFEQIICVCRKDV